MSERYIILKLRDKHRTTFSWNDWVEKQRAEFGRLIEEVEFPTDDNILEHLLKQAKEDRERS